MENTENRSTKAASTTSSEPSTPPSRTFEPIPEEARKARGAMLLELFRHSEKPDKEIEALAEQMKEKAGGEA